MSARIEDISRKLTWDTGDYVVLTRAEAKMLTKHLLYQEVAVLELAMNRSEEAADALRTILEANSEFRDALADAERVVN